MAPSAIGVPVAATPGLVPHCVVLTAAVLGALVLAGALLVLLLVLLLHPAAAMATAAASTIVLRADGACICLLIYPPQGGEFQVILMLCARQTKSAVQTKSALFTGRPWALQ
jgi:hypothetical protein